MSWYDYFRKPVEEAPTITVDAHKDIVADYEKDLQAERETVGRLVVANRALKGELAYWKQHGQLRDPKTGRLIPKAKVGELVA